MPDPLRSQTTFEFVEGYPEGMHDKEWSKCDSDATHGEHRRMDLEIVCTLCRNNGHCLPSRATNHTQYLILMDEHLREPQSRSIILHKSSRIHTTHIPSFLTEHERLLEVIVGDGKRDRLRSAIYDALDDNDWGAFSMSSIVQKEVSKNKGFVYSPQSIDS